MNKQLFLTELERLLSELPSSEREEALEYYRNYFEDAGVEEEEKVIAALGNPTLVAKLISENFRGDTSTYEYSENGFANSNVDSNTKVGMVRELDATQETKERNWQKLNTTNRVLLGVIAILTFPIWFSLFLTAVAIVFSVFAMGAGIGLAAFMMILVGFLLLFVGLFKVLTIPLAGIVMVGIACAIVGGSILLFWLIVSVLVYFVPACIRSFVWVCKLPFHGMRMG